MPMDPRPVQVVLVHGVRTSATMWRAQIRHLTERGTPFLAPDLPGHGTRMAEEFTLEAAFATIDAAVRDSATRGPVLLVGHSMGGILSTVYVGQETPPPVDAYIASCSTAIPRGPGLMFYRTIMDALVNLPDRGAAITQAVLRATLPEETRGDFGAGGYADHIQDAALASLASLDLPEALKRIRIPMWFVNGQYDQLRINERLFTSLVPHAELIVVPQATHLVTAMQPRVFNAVIDLGIATLEAARLTGSPE